MGDGMKSITTSNLDAIDNRYNPDFDMMPNGFPQVTWADWYLADALRDLIKEIEKLEANLEEARSEIRTLKFELMTGGRNLRPND